MDLKALLPLLLAGNKNGESIAPLINAVSAGAKGDKSDKSAENDSVDFFHICPIQQMKTPRRIACGH